MMANLIERIFRPQIERAILNQFNRAFYGQVGTYATSYDPNNKSVYLEEGYLSNPIVFSIINQRAKKATQIPFYIKKVKDSNSKKEFDMFTKATNHMIRPQQNIRKKELKEKAFEEKFLDMPLPRPNPLQTWGDIKGMYETNMSYSGNSYFYKLMGDFSKDPLAVYPLPSHLMMIVLKKDASMLGVENPIDYYMLIEGDTYVKFEVEEIIHIKYPNPEYDQNGAHLYGLSPLRAGIKNIQSSNLGLDLNTDTLLNGGAFGFIHGKNGKPLSQTQADSIKDRMREMSVSKDVLGKIRGTSGELGFTQIRLSAKEMELFKYFAFDQKQLCNILGWDDKLLNNDEGAKYDNVQSAEQRVVVNTTIPSLQLFDEAMTDQFIKLFKGYENAVLQHDPSDLPEMQQDIAEMVTWLSVAKSDGVLNGNEYRSALNYPISDDPNMEIYTVKDDIMPLSEALDNQMNLNEPTNI